ncbi:hypothetical protein [Spirillospora sp. NPDC047279]|uniref:hypothetical protein n=1 Tax=Spirillospora sp. NPDC047279 TaxID=3155478 RepID=UPI0033E9EB57
MLSHALHSLGQANLIVGRLERAERYMRDSRRLREAADHPSLHDRQALAAVLRRGGRLADAAQEILADLVRARAIGDGGGEAMALMELASIPEQERPAGVPAQPVEAALVVYREMGDVHGEIRALLQLGQQATERAELHQAVEHFADCARLAADIGEHQTAAQASASLGTLHGGIGQVAEAEAYFADAHSRQLLDHLEVTRQTLLAITRPQPHGPEPAAELQLPPGYSEILALLAGHPHGLHPKDIAAALGHDPTSKNTVEGIRAKLKRLVGRDLATEPQKGLFIIKEPES